MKNLISGLEVPMVIYNRYSDELLDKLKLSDTQSCGNYSKSPLSPKQKKARNKTRQQKQSRRNNRKK